MVNDNRWFRVLILAVLLPAMAAAGDLTVRHDRRVEDMKSAFEEITESFRQRVLDLERDIAAGRESADAERGALQAERNAALAARDAALAVRDATMAERDKAVAERDTAMAERDTAARALDTAQERVTALEEALAEVRPELDTLRERTGGQTAELDRLRGALVQAQEANRRERFALAYNLGNIYKAARQYTRAEAEFQKALQMKPEDSALHYNMGILYDDNLRNTQKARYHYERFLALAPGDPDAPNVVKWLKELGVR